jgi:ribose/xylose/arabinose/galactoside ABC-type transport system permease subunit
MSWLAWFGFAVILTGAAAVTGIKPKATRHVAHTRLMGIARVLLWFIAIVFVYQAWRAYATP